MLANNPDLFIRPYGKSFIVTDNDGKNLITTPRWGCIFSSVEKAEDFAKTYYFAPEDIEDDQSTDELFEVPLKEPCGV